MKLVIAEKPMLGRDIARAICGKQVSESARLPIEGNGYKVCACAGHLFELVDPSEYDEKFSKWTLEDLPITFDNWRKKPADGKGKLVKELKGYIAEADEIIHAGDPDDEGQLIVDELLEYCHNTKPVKRVYVNDNIEKNIRRAFEELKDNSEGESSGRAAYARQMADMCFGVNETRLATKKLGAGKVLSLGRVQTPTLGLIVQRDLAIEGHQKQKFYELEFLGAFDDGNRANYQGVLKFLPSKSILGDEKHILDVSVLENVKQALGGNSVACEVLSSKKHEKPPLPYNLTVLQSDMSKRFKYSAKKTLDLTQSLRDNYKAITYNRSDSQYLKSEHYEQAESTLGIAMRNLSETWQLDFSLKSTAFNDSNVTAHHGIIPQDISVDVSKMSKDEANVYRAIVERYAFQFMKPAEYDVSTGVIEVENGKLKYEAKKLVGAGWKAHGEDEKKDEIEANVLVPEGDYVVKLDEGKIVEKETTPPKRYTEGTLIADMACISKYVKDSEIKEILKKKDDGKKGENGGIGTTATRASIIETLKKRGYVEEEKGKLISTKLARTLYKMLPEDIKGADVTARWWLIQQEIEEGKADVNSIMHSVVDVFNSHKDTAYAGMNLGSQEKKVVGKCPKCSKNVVYNGKFFQCESNKWTKQDDGSWVCKEGCQFSLYGYGGKKFTEEQVKALLAGHEIEVKGFKSKNPNAKKKTHSRKFKLNKVGGLDAYF